MQLTLHEKLKKLRESNNYSQNDVADKLNISRQAISRWETGKSYPDLDNLVLLSKLYGISIDSLLENDVIASSSEECDHPPDETADNTFAPSQKKLLEQLALFSILAISSQFAFLGLVVSIVILIWLLYNHKHYKLILLLCVFCICIGVYNSFILLNHFFWKSGNATINTI